MLGCLELFPLERATLNDSAHFCNIFGIALKNARVCKQPYGRAEVWWSPRLQVICNEDLLYYRGSGFPAAMVPCGHSIARGWKAAPTQPCSLKNQFVVQSTNNALIHNIFPLVQEALPAFLHPSFSV